MLSSPLLSLAVFVITTIAPPTGSPVKGSLILAIPYKDGLLIAADKRAANSQGSFDDAVKVGEAGTFTAVTSTGIAQSGQHIEGPEPWILTFSATDTICHALRTKSLDSDIQPLLSSTAQALRSRLIAFSVTPEGALLPSGIPLFVSRIYHFNRQKNNFQMATLTINYDKADPGRTEIFGTCEDIEVSFCYPQGRAELLSELWKGVDTRFDGLRSSKFVSKFLKNPVPFKQVSQEQACKAALYFISITSRSNHMLVPGDATVSEAADVFVISRTKGFGQLRTNVRFSK